MKNWWQFDLRHLSQEIQTDLETGLTDAQVNERLGEYGQNKLMEKPGRTALGIFIEQFQNFIIWVLIGAALVSGFLKEWVDAGAIVGIVIINAFLGLIQEYRAEKSLAALKKLSSPNSKVIRNGRHATIAAADLVPGDLVELEAGDNIPADARIIYATPNTSTAEASLTGESTPVDKTAMALEEKELPLADRANMVYMGTSMVAGKARAIIVETGMRTELGKIAGMIMNVIHEETPLQKKLSEFGRWIVYICFVLVAMVFAMEYFRGGKILEVFLTAVSLAVAAIPEGLPAVVTIALALGVHRMVKRHVLIRKLPAVQTLGCVTVICSDKTGTLTKNEMTVRALWTKGASYRVSGIGYEPKGKFSVDGKELSKTEELGQLLECSVLCNGAQLVESGGVYKIIGDPTEGALITAAAKAGLNKKQLENDYPFVEELPFDSNRKKMTVVRKSGQGCIAYVKGAPDILLNDCTMFEQAGGATQLTDERRQEILGVNNQLANEAMRVLALAYRPLEAKVDQYEAGQIERDLVFLGLIAMIDPPREEVKEAVRVCRHAGIKTVMITGDHKNTAVAIAAELGFYTEGSLALTGEELDKLSDEEFAEKVTHIPVYARVSPENKLRIVRAWRHRGDVVSMTGDGVNDAPAVKEADIGVAMGITGTDVTKEVSDMVVTDDNFASIVAAVEEGRGIYENIKKFIHYLLSCNVGEILVMFVASAIGMPIPLLPIHILWVNLVTDGLPALALGMDPIEPGIMNEKPRDPNEGILTWSRGVLMILQGSFIAACTLAAFSYVYYYEERSVENAQTAAFIVLSLSQLFHSFNCRSQLLSVFKLGIFSNIKLVYATALSAALVVIVVYFPVTQRVFRTFNLSGTEWIMALIISSLPLVAMEIIKLINRKFGFFGK